MILDEVKTIETYITDTVCVSDSSQIMFYVDVVTNNDYYMAYLYLDDSDIKELILTEGKSAVSHSGFISILDGCIKINAEKYLRKYLDGEDYYIL